MNKLSSECHDGLIYQSRSDWQLILMIRTKLEETEDSVQTLILDFNLSDIHVYPHVLKHTELTLVLLFSMPREYTEKRSFISHTLRSHISTCELDVLMLWNLPLNLLTF